MTRSRWIVLTLITALVVAFFYFDLNELLTLENIKAEQVALEQLAAESPIEFVSAFFLFYVVATAISLPGAAIMLTLIAGAILGFFQPAERHLDAALFLADGFSDEGFRLGEESIQGLFAPDQTLGAGGLHVFGKSIPLCRAGGAAEHAVQAGPNGFLTSDELVAGLAFIEHFFAFGGITVGPCRGRNTSAGHRQNNSNHRNETRRQHIPCYYLQL